MKNSTLLFRLMALVGVVLFLLFYPFVLLGILFLLILIGVFVYLIICLFELDGIGKYGNEVYEYIIIPRKYNYITVFIDWVNSFPPIIKKK